MSPNFKAVLIVTAIAVMFTGMVARADTPRILTGDVYAEIGAGYSTSFFQSNERYQWENGGSPGFYGSIRYELMLDRDRLGVVVHYMHASNWFVGPPFNDDGESSLDHIGIAVRWKLTNR